MQRAVVSALFCLAALIVGRDALADSSSRGLASYYERHMAVVGGVAWGWEGRGEPRRLLAGVVQVGVGRDAWFALRDDGTLITWADAPATATTLMRGVASFAAGHSGWFAIDRAGTLWHAGGSAAAPKRGQYGDGRLAGTADFVATATDAVAVKAHTGHAIHLRRDGVVMGTGGNRYGPLSTHGLGDKATRWGRLFDGAVAIATGARHSAAIRGDASLWAWGAGFAVEPRKLVDGVVAVAAGETATIARLADGTILQWDGGGTPRRLTLR